MSDDLKERIEKLQMEIQAMQKDPLLQGSYPKKVMELIKLRKRYIARRKKDKNGTH